MRLTAACALVTFTLTTVAWAAPSAGPSTLRAKQVADASRSEQRNGLEEAMTRAGRRQAPTVTQPPRTLSLPTGLEEVFRYYQTMLKRSRGFEQVRMWKPQKTVLYSSKNLRFQIYFSPEWFAVDMTPPSGISLAQWKRREKQQRAGTLYLLPYQVPQEDIVSVMEAASPQEGPPGRYLTVSRRSNVYGTRPTEELLRVTSPDPQRPIVRGIAVKKGTLILRLDPATGVSQQTFQVGASTLVVKPAAGGLEEGIPTAFEEYFRARKAIEAAYVKESRKGPLDEFEARLVGGDDVTAALDQLTTVLRHAAVSEEQVAAAFNTAWDADRESPRGEIKVEERERVLLAFRVAQAVPYAAAMEYLKVWYSSAPMLSRPKWAPLRSELEVIEKIQGARTNLAQAVHAAGAVEPEEVIRALQSLGATLKRPVVLSEVEIRTLRAALATSSSAGGLEEGEQVFQIRGRPVNVGDILESPTGTRYQVKAIHPQTLIFTQLDAKNQEGRIVRLQKPYEMTRSRDESFDRWRLVPRDGLEEMTVEQAQQALQDLAAKWGLAKLKAPIRVAAVTPAVVQNHPEWARLIGHLVPLGHSAFVIVPESAERQTSLVEVLHLLKYLGSDGVQFTADVHEIQSYGSADDRALNDFEDRVRQELVFSRLLPRQSLANGPLRELLRQVVANLSGWQPSAIQDEDLDRFEQILKTLA